MTIKKNKTIKVGNQITPIHFKKRKEPELIIGNDYFVSFGMNKAIPCILLDVIDNGKEIPKEVKIGIKDNSEIGYGDINIVYSDEIGLTSEEAVINTRTS
ncbi:MAG: hypothetical protein ABIP68_04800 [Ferruginibacter sp.]